MLLPPHQHPVPQLGRSSGRSSSRSGGRSNGRSSGPRSFTWIHVNYSNLRQWRSSKKMAFSRRAPGGFLGGKRAEAPVPETPNESTQNFRGLSRRCGAPEENRAPSAEGHLWGSWGGHRAEAPVSGIPKGSTQNICGNSRRCGAPEDRAPSAEGHLWGSWGSRLANGRHH